MATLLLSLCVVTVIQLTSSQSTYDVIQQDSCGHNAQILYQLQKDMGELKKDMAELKAAIGHKSVNGMWLGRWSGFSQGLDVRFSSTVVMF